MNHKIQFAIFNQPAFKSAIWIIIILGILIRLINIQLPLLEGASTRQIYNAMVARYFYEHRLNFFYPFMEIRGNNPYVQALEAPVIPYLGAICYHIWGGESTELLRIISVISCAIAAFFLYRLISLISDRDTAVTAAFIFTFSPISIFAGRSALHEMSLMLFTIGAVYCFLRWTKEEKITFAIWANLFFIMAVLIKKTNLYLLLPLGYLAFSKWRWQAVKKNYLAFFSILLILAWQVWEGYLRMRFPEPRWVHFNLKYNISRIIFSYSSIDFYKKVYLDIVHYALTPLGLTFLLIGFLFRLEKGVSKVLYFWLAGVMSFYLIMPEQLWAHGYYHLHYLPLAAFFIARGFIFVVDKLSTSGKAIFLNRKILLLFFAVVFLLMSMRYSLFAYQLPQSKSAVISTAAEIRNVVNKDKLIITVCDNPTALLYYAQRRGWPVHFPQEISKSKNISLLNDLRSKGAEYLACAYKIELKQNKDFWKYLSARYKIIFENDYSVILDLK